MSLVKDVTIGEGESVPPDTPFTKTWRIQNTGKSARNNNDNNNYNNTIEQRADARPRK